MTDTYKLIYFNTRARGEPIRLIFALADVQYEDFRIERSEWTPEYKDSFPWGQLPVLEVNGKRLAQSSSICRYLARKFNLTGADEFEAARCDELVDAMMDLRAEWRAFFWEADKERQAMLKKNLIEVSFPKFFPKFEKIVNDSDGDFLLGKTVTWADLHIAHTLNFYTETVQAECLKGYPALKKFIEAVFNIPRIKAWVERRPKNHM